MKEARDSMALILDHTTLADIAKSNPKAGREKSRRSLVGKDY